MTQITNTFLLVDDKMSFICPQCTMINSTRLDQCELCGYQNKSQSSCPRCTFENDVDSKSCMMCEFIFVALATPAKKAKIEEKSKTKYVISFQTISTEIAQSIYQQFIYFRNTASVVLIQLHNLNQLYNLIEIVNTSEDKKRHGQSEYARDCQVCFDTFREIAPLRNCGHDRICRNCVVLHIQTRIREQEVVPWIKCPDLNCGCPIATLDLLELLENDDLHEFCLIFAHKLLIRQPNFVTCVTQKCCNGWWFEELDDKQNVLPPNGVFQTEICVKCETKQTPGGLDAEFEAQIRSGKMRGCPICKAYTSKELGVCNLIQCASCNIWWNWQTKTTSESYEALKNNARTQNSLWQAADFQYQSELEKKDPIAFKALLERNGITYKANYVRGRS